MRSLRIQEERNTTAERAADAIKTQPTRLGADKAVAMLLLRWISGEL
jgi:hypothetical protein